MLENLTLPIRMTNGLNETVEVITRHTDGRYIGVIDGEILNWSTRTAPTPWSPAAPMISASPRSPAAGLRRPEQRREEPQGARLQSQLPEAGGPQGPAPTPEPGPGSPINGGSKSQLKGDSTRKPQAETEHYHSQLIGWHRYSGLARA
jgi:hypothetical protein